MVIALFFIKESKYCLVYLLFLEHQLLRYFYFHKLGSLEAEIRTQEAYGGESWHQQLKDKKAHDRVEGEGLVINASTYPTWVLKLDDPLELSRGGTVLYLFSSISQQIQATWERVWSEKWLSSESRLIALLTIKGKSISVLKRDASSISQFVNSLLYYSHLDSIYD